MWTSGDYPLQTLPGGRLVSEAVEAKDLLASLVYACEKAAEANSDGASVDWPELDDAFRLARGWFERNDPAGPKRSVAAPPRNSNGSEAASLPAKKWATPPVSTSVGTCRRERVSPERSFRAAQAMEISERQKRALDYLETHGRITNRIYRSLAYISQKTAHTDLVDLCRRRLLERKGSGPSTCYTRRRG